MATVAIYWMYYKLWSLASAALRNASAYGASTNWLAVGQALRGGGVRVMRRFRHALAFVLLLTTLIALASVHLSRGEPLPTPKPMLVWVSEK